MPHIRGLLARLPQGQRVVLGSDPGGTQQGHHVQGEGDENAEQGNELEGTEDVDLVRGHPCR